MTEDKPNWHTETVRSLCNALFRSNDVTACKILADALQEAGYPDATGLIHLRAPDLTPYAAKFIVGQIYQGRVIPSDVMHYSHRPTTTVGACDPKIAKQCPFVSCDRCQARAGSPGAAAQCPKEHEHQTHNWVEVDMCGRGKDFFKCSKCDLIRGHDGTYEPCSGVLPPRRPSGPGIHWLDALNA